MGTAARSGKYSLRLFSSSCAKYYDYDKFDWVTTASVSKPVALDLGDVVRISGWVNVPKRMEQTDRGAIVGDSIGGAGFVEFVQVEPTDGWKHFSVIREYRWGKKPLDFGVRLALCGIGEAYFDDISLQKLVADE